LRGAIITAISGKRGFIFHGKESAALAGAIIAGMLRQQSEAPVFALPHCAACGVVLGLAASGFMAGQDALIKWGGGGYSVFQVIFLRSVASLFVAAAWLFYERRALRLPRRKDVAAIGALANVGAFLCFYAAIDALDLTVFTCLLFLAPIFVSVLSAPLLKERPSARQWAALAAGFGGVLVIAAPWDAVYGADLAAVVLMILGGALWAVAMLSARALGDSASTGVIFFYTSAVFLLVGALAQPFVWRMPEAADAAALLSAGLVGAMAQGGFILAYRAARAPVVAPTEYSMLAWAMLWGWLFWGEIITPALFAGAVLVIAAGLAVLPRRRLQGAK
jgi:drug/metabolite transporter (DMT)-like permease